MTNPHFFPVPPSLYSSGDWAGRRVGLFGGSFNPPHEGHLHNSEIALKYLGLDAIWWLVTPGNPLKTKSGLPDVTTRAAACRALTRSHPRLFISDIECTTGTVRTYDTITEIQKRFPRTSFIWVAGTENAHEFPKWHKWRDLMHMIPFAFIGRPSRFGIVRHNCFRADHCLTHHFPQAGCRPPLASGHIYWLFCGKRNPLSSTAIRTGAKQPHSF